jgi:hypothetical protein
VLCYQNFLNVFPHDDLDQLQRLAISEWYFQSIKDTRYADSWNEHYILSTSSPGPNMLDGVGFWDRALKGLKESTVVESNCLEQPPDRCYSWFELRVCLACRDFQRIRRETFFMVDMSVSARRHLRVRLVAEDGSSPLLPYQSYNQTPCLHPTMLCSGARIDLACCRLRPVELITDINGFKCCASARAPGPKAEAICQCRLDNFSWNQEIYISPSFYWMNQATKMRIIHHLAQMPRRLTRNERRMQQPHFGLRYTRETLY